MVAGLVRVFERPNNLSIDFPCDSILGPVEGVDVKFGLGRFDWFLSSPVVNTCDTFAEIVCLHKTTATAVTEVVARPLQIDFVLVVTHKHAASDQTCSRRCLNFHIDTTKKEIFVGPDVGCVVALGKGKVGAVVATERHTGVISQNEVAWQGSLFHHFVHKVGIECRNWVGTCLSSWVAGLSCCERPRGG